MALVECTCMHCQRAGQLSVKVFLGAAGIKETREKEKGIVKHFSQATGVEGAGAFHACQSSCNLPQHKFVKDCDTRWGGAHDQMEFFRVNQRAVQLYDVNHARRAGDAYKCHQMGLEDWTINLQAVAVLQPLADWTQHMQASKGYATLPLVLPTIYNIIDSLSPSSPLQLHFPGEAPYELTPAEMHPPVLAARTLMHMDWMERWVDQLDRAVKRTLAIATLLHPSFKEYDFIDDLDFIPAGDKSWALRELRNEWLFVWKLKTLKARTVDGQPSDSASGAVDLTTEGELEGAAVLEQNKGSMVQTTCEDVSYTKKRKVTLGGLLRTKKTAAADQVAQEKDELEQYLASPVVDENVNVLDWWKVRGSGC